MRSKKERRDESEPRTPESEAAAMLGRRGGLRATPAQKEASRRNLVAANAARLGALKNKASKA